MTLAVCLPGCNFTDGWAKSWTQFLAYCFKEHIKLEVFWSYNSSVLHVRNALLEPGPGSPKKDCKPFDGKVMYDYMLWIDSDMAWEVQDVLKLIEADKDIITGLCPVNTDGVGALGFINDFSPVKYMILGGIEETEPFEIEFCGFAFLLVKKGVFEAMEYPWFKYREIDVDGRIVVPAEDFAWCIRARELGYKIYAHPEVGITHEKRVSLLVGNQRVDETNLMAQEESNLLLKG